jgi:hypothetical protein
MRGLFHPGIPFDRHEPGDLSKTFVVRTDRSAVPYLQCLQKLDTLFQRGLQGLPANDVPLDYFRCVLISSEPNEIPVDLPAQAYTKGLSAMKHGRPFPVAIDQTALDNRDDGCNIILDFGDAPPAPPKRRRLSGLAGSPATPLTFPPIARGAGGNAGGVECTCAAIFFFIIIIIKQLLR